MSIAEMKEKIISEVNHLTNENTLQQVLSILNNKGENESQHVDAMKYKDKLFEKHNGLLERLS